MQNLNYHLNPPTTFCFVEAFRGFLDELALSSTTKNEVIQKAIHLADLSVTEASLTSISPSTIGFAAILNALEIESVEQGGEPTIFSSMFMEQSKSKRYFDAGDINLTSTREKLWSLYEQSAMFDTLHLGTKSSPLNCHYFDTSYERHHSTEELSPVQVDGNVLMYLG